MNLEKANKDTTCDLEYVLPRSRKERKARASKKIDTYEKRKRAYKFSHQCHIDWWPLYLSLDPKGDDINELMSSRLHPLTEKEIRRIEKANGDVLKPFEFKECFNHQAISERYIVGPRELSQDDLYWRCYHLDYKLTHAYRLKHFQKKDDKCRTKRRIKSRKKRQVAHNM